MVLIAQSATSSESLVGMAIESDMERDSMRCALLRIATVVAS